jgi:hypothetical protein
MLARRSVPVCVAAAFLLLTAANATTLARLTLDQLAAGADAVARVRCVSADSRWESSSIWTLTTAEVVETMKGNLPREVSIRLPGGRAGHFIATVEGTPKFHPGDEAILFLTASRLGGYTVEGWVEGTFRIAHDAGGAETVTQDSSAFGVFDPAARSFRNEGIRHMPIEEFRTRVAAALAHGRTAAWENQR